MKDWFKLKASKIDLRLFKTPRRGKGGNMRKRKKDRSKSISTKKHGNVKNEAILLTKRAGFDPETEESLIKEIKEISAFEDSLED